VVRTKRLREHASVGRVVRRYDSAAPDRSRILLAEQRFVLTLWTDDPDLAREADEAGIDRIGVDLETHGKSQRQAGRGTWISSHEVASLPAIRQGLVNARLFARVNPVSPASAAEIERLLSVGVQVLMVPMFRTAEEVATFAAMVDGRATVVPLVETTDAAADIERIVAIPAIGEIHVGINDLALALGARNRFEVLDSVLVERLSNTVRAAGLRFGIGGIGRIGDTSLPIPPDLLYAQYARLGATAALLSRAFTSGPRVNGELVREVAASRARLEHWHRASATELDTARSAFRTALEHTTCW
jgi:2-keto-3-deoxy-L-rhamnonate aldolase RhmA